MDEEKVESVGYRIGLFLGTIFWAAVIGGVIGLVLKFIFSIISAVTAQPGVW